MIVGEHMGWCRGTHDTYGQCVWQVDDHHSDGAVTVRVTAVPCGYAAQLIVEADVRTVEALDALRARLERARAVFVASRAETHCDEHDHGG